MKIELCLSGANDHFYLLNMSVLRHSFHPPVVKESQTLKQDDLTPEEQQWVHNMFNTGLMNGMIAQVMTRYANKLGRDGSFEVSTIRSITDKYQKEIDAISGVDLSFSIAQKTIA